VRVDISWGIFIDNAKVVDPILFLLLHRPLMASWIDSLTGAMQFLSHVSVPLGSNSDNKILLTKSVADAMDQSPVNFPLLLDALIGLDKDTPVPCAFFHFL
jgi:hypothetical protein